MRGNSVRFDPHVVGVRCLSQSRLLLLCQLMRERAPRLHHLSLRQGATHRENLAQLNAASVVDLEKRRAVSRTLHFRVCPPHTGAAKWGILAGRRTK